MHQNWPNDKSKGNYPSYTSVVVMRQHDQGIFKRNHFIGGLAYRFRGLVHEHYAMEAWQQVGRHDWGTVAELLHPDLQPGGRDRLGLAWGFEASKPTPSNTFPSTRLHFPTFFINSLQAGDQTLKCRSPQKGKGKKPDWYGEHTAWSTAVGDLEKHAVGIFYVKNKLFPPFCCIFLPYFV